MEVGFRPFYRLPDKKDHVHFPGFFSIPSISVAIFSLAEEMD